MNINFRSVLAIVVICLVSSFATGLAVNRHRDSQITSLESTVQRLYLQLDKQKGENSSLHSRLLIQKDQLAALGVAPIKVIGTQDQDRLPLGCRMLGTSRVAC